MLTKEETDRIVQIEGMVRGAVFQTDSAYIRWKEGDEGLDRLEHELHRMGYPIEYEKIKAMEWYSLGLRALSLVVMSNIFNWKIEEFKRMGNNAPKHSFIVKLLMKFFISPGVAFSNAPKYWERQYSIGKLESTELNEKSKYGMVRLKDFKVNTLYCKYLEGYFRRLFQYLFPNEEIEVSEKKCMFRGDEYHAYKVFW